MSNRQTFPVRFQYGTELYGLTSWGRGELTIIGGSLMVEGALGGLDMHSTLRPLEPMEIREVTALLV